MEAKPCPHGQFHELVECNTQIICNKCGFCAPVVKFGTMNYFKGSFLGDTQFSGWISAILTVGGKQTPFTLFDRWGVTK